MWTPGTVAPGTSAPKSPPCYSTGRGPWPTPALPRTITVVRRGNAYLSAARPVAYNTPVSAHVQATLPHAIELLASSTTPPSVFTPTKPRVSSISGRVVWQFHTRSKQQGTGHTRGRVKVFRPNYEHPHLEPGRKIDPQALGPLPQALPSLG